ncbi:hypothetical protein NC651_018233 [Populus alba x Populus x berolinensis]|nr:hypothetical protein NC651_018233 [Populus alba x Populus x berolinensis]
MALSLFNQHSYRPTIPKHAHPKLAKLLEVCWQQNPNQRPNFSQIRDIHQQIAKEETGIPPPTSAFRLSVSSALAGVREGSLFLVWGVMEINLKSPPVGNR